ncbi:MAG: GDP-mannose 4,6-dehydratase, partial [Thaumarchaeota archaeon]|nr:GDP-mannose 4,6-dehydratase [Nitrososphaerota archaeon]
MRILVTGVAGFIGSHLCSSLLGRGFEVWGLDDLSRGDRGRVEELEELGLRFVRVDIRDCVEVEKVLREARPVGVAHLAALISVPESFEKPDLYMAVNVEGTRNLVSAANEVGVERFVYASSAAVYGNPVRLPIDEEHPTKPISPYGESKLLGEKCVLNEFRGSAFSLRLFNVYGRGQN